MKCLCMQLEEIIFEIALGITKQWGDYLISGFSLEHVAAAPISNYPNLMKMLFCFSLSHIDCKISVINLLKF